MLLELKKKADQGRLVGDFSYAYELSEVVSKIKIIFNEKFHVESLEYFENLGCEVKRGIPYEESKDHMSITIFEPNYRYKPQWQIKVPIEIAEKALVIGFP